MFGNLGMPEILLLVFVALLFFGGRKLPELGKSIGEGIKNFRGAMSDGMKDTTTPPAAPDEKK